MKRIAISLLAVCLYLSAVAVSDIESDFETYYNLSTEDRSKPVAEIIANAIRFCTYNKKQSELVANSAPLSHDIHLLKEELSRIRNENAQFQGTILGHITTREYNQLKRLLEQLRMAYRIHLMEKEIDKLKKKSCRRLTPAEILGFLDESKNED